MLHDMKLSFTTDSDGNAVVYGERTIKGRLIAVMYDRGDMVTGADLTLTWDRYGVTETVFNPTNVGTADFISYPRRLVQDAADGDLTGAAGGDREPYLILGRPKLTVAQGGDIKSGALILIYEEG